MRVASMKRMSPPFGVQASPTATPGSSVRSAISEKKRSGPSSSRTFATVQTTGSVFPSVMARATLRQTRPISRSRFRRPASRV